jgi:3',5'-nucleoside bisphosphate phosphatase
MRGNLLLCELHAHTTWSDGELTLPELVDLYGSFEFDVLCVTDHLLPPSDEWAGLATEIVPAYVEEIEREATRALAQ